MADRKDASAESTAPLITPRVLAGLSVIALAQGALTAACVLPAFSLFGIPALPAALAATTLSLALLLAPAWSGDPRVMLESRMQQAGRCLFLALWPAAALAFFLLVATRVAPFPSAAILRAALILGAAVWLALAVARRWPKAYFGLVLFWAVVVPMSVFVVAEVFISTPGGSMGWSRGSGPGVDTFRRTMEWSLRFSPATALIGALQGRLPGDAPCGWRETGAFVALCGLCGVLLHRRTVRRASPPDTPDRTS